jgi:hypothetical protein
MSRQLPYNLRNINNQNHCVKLVPLDCDQHLTSHARTLLDLVLSDDSSDHPFISDELGLESNLVWRSDALRLKEVHYELSMADCGKSRGPNHNEL